MNLAEEIAALLYRHDCVIVPDFGGFLSQYRSADLQRGLQRIVPPGKDISFNRELKRNDGLLTDHIGRFRQVSYAEALKWVQDHVGEWQKELDATKRLELQGLGVFLLGSEGRLVFQPDKEADFSMDAFGLRTTQAIPLTKEIPLEPVQEEEVAIIPIAEGKPKPEIQEQESAQKKRQVLPYWSAAAVAALIVTGFTMALLNTDLGGDGQLADMWPFSEKSAAINLNERGSAVPAERRSPDEFLAIDELQESVDLTGDELVNHPVKSSLVEAEPESTFVETASPEHHYHIVVGCFGIERNAHKLVERYKSRGVEARVLDQKGGLHRVVESSFATRREALDRLKSVKNSGEKGAWLLLK